MRIISNFTDYYDYMLSYGIDSNIVYPRYTEEYKDIYNHLLNKIDKETQTTLKYRYRDSGHILSYSLIIVCNKIFKVEIIESISTGACHFCYTEEETKSFKELAGDETKKIRRYFSDYGKRHFFNVGVTEIDNDTGIPLIVLNRETAIINPKLLDYKFNRVYSGDTLFNDISMFLSKEKVIENNIPDKYKIEQHGFNKASFRNM
jgi:hypothetical protein